MNFHRMDVVTRALALAAVFVNIVIHLALTPMHLVEAPYIGVLFVVGSVLLGAVMVGLLVDRNSLRAWAWLGGSAVCAVELVLFVISRTSGLPNGYHEAWAASSEDVLGLVSLAVEAIFIGCATRMRAECMTRAEFVTAFNGRKWN